jgi:L-rhamnose mutarotase
MRRAFIMRLKPGALAEYARRHGAVWPELEAEMVKAGIRQFTIYEDDPILVVASDVADPTAWAKLWSSDVHRRWGELMDPLMAFGDDGPESTEMREVYHFSAPQEGA